MKKDKDAARKEIERLTKEYLDKGKAIELIPNSPVARTDIEWIARRGFDYTPWHLL